MNINTKTKIPYGVISANGLNPDVVQELMFGRGSVDISFSEFAQDIEYKLREQLVDEGWPDEGWPDDEFEVELEVELERRMRREIDAYECDEPVVGGVLDDTRYGTVWLGGALHFCILESPVITRCAPCSPCVPNAGDLDNKGDYRAYGVPDDWLA